MINVIHLLGSLNRGGAEILALDIFSNIKNTQINMTGIYRKTGILQTEFNNTGINLYKLSPKSIFDIIYLIQLRQLIKQKDIHIVHAHQVIDALIGLIATIGLNVKVIITFHGYLLGKTYLQKTIRKFVIERTNANIFVSKSLKDYYVTKYFNLNTTKQKILYNGVSFNKIDAVSKSNIRDEFNISENAFLMAMIGSFTSVRDQFTVCKFLLLLKKQDINFRFLFVGAKSEEEHWLYDKCYDFCKINCLEENVKFLGVRSDIPEILNTLDLFIYSTARDTFGIAVVEAMAAGIPVFINDWEVFKEITENGKYVTLYKTKDENDLLAKFKDYLSNPEPYKQKAFLSTEYVKQNFSIEKHIQKLEYIYNELIN